MAEKHLILTGFMGTGKTTVGRLLAERLQRPFIDTDAAIAADAGQSIAAIFAAEGEDGFRARELALAAQLATRSSAVIATGGGFLLSGRVRALLGTHTIICLTAEPDTILQRVGSDGSRPLLAVPEPRRRIADLLHERRAVYSRFPQVATDGLTPEAVADAVLALPAGGTARRADPTRLTVTHPAGRYDIVIGHGLLQSLHEFYRPNGALAVITDGHVGPHYAARLGAAATVLTIPPGEQHKTTATVNTLYSGLLAAGIDRSSTVVALGGGVVGDVAGFVAATYMRGVAFVQCPTSLLAMVDASIGGKTGVDLPEGKNLVGAFKQPEAVVIDLDTLATLPTAEFAAGMAEVIKAGLIGAPALFERLEHAPLRPDDPAPAAVVRQAVAVKRDIVVADPFERLGQRALLNLGHTFGHALEQVSGYRLRHGEAVALGMVVAARVSAELGHCRPGLVDRIERALGLADLPTRIPADLAPDAVMQMMGSDKKKQAGRLHFILLRDVGDVFMTDAVDPARIRAHLAQLADGDPLGAAQP